MTSTTPSGSPPTTPPIAAEVPGVPNTLRVAGSIAWRVIALGVVAWGLAQIVSSLSSVILAVAVALLLTALLAPLMRVIRRRVKVPPHLLAALVLLLMIAGVVEISRRAGVELATGFEDLQDTVLLGYQRLDLWLQQGQLGFGGQKMSDVLEHATTWLQENRGSITRGAVSAGGSAATFITGLLIALVSAFFFVADGRTIFSWLVSLLPVRARTPARLACERGWNSVEAYARTQIVVAFADAVGIAAGALWLGVPFVLPIAVIVFLTAFVPVVGALVSGAIAVLVALAFEGFKTALLMLIVVLVVQQLESNVLQPVLMGKAVSLHPWATIIGVAVGGTLLGIVGALFAVPVMAFVNTALRSLYGRWTPPEPPEPGPVSRAWKRITAMSESR